MRGGGFLIVSAAIDGKPVALELPVRITIEPQALRVLVPQAGSA